MSQSYRIETLGHFSLYEEGGSKGDFLITVDGSDQELHLFYDRSSDYGAPQVGDEVYGEITQGKFGKWRLSRKARPKGGGGSSSTGGGGGSTGQKTDDNYDRRPDHPLVIAQRLHTSCLSTGREVLKDLLDVGFVKANDANEYFRLLEHVAARLTKTYPAEVLERASTAAGIVVGVPVQVNGGGGEVPADTAGLPTAAVSSDSQIEF